MAKSSITVPQKKNASSSRPAGDKIPVEPRPEECVPGGCVLTSDFKIDKTSSVPGRCLGKDAVMRPLSSEEETSIPTPKLAKDKKRKKTSSSKDPEPKKKAARKPKKNIILLIEDSVRRLREKDEEEEEDDSELVARVGISTEARKATESVKAAETPSQDEGAKKIEDLEARLASKLAKAKSEAEKSKADVDAIVAVYRADAEATQVQAREVAETAQTRAHWIAELTKCQSRRETLEEIHARGFDLTDEIVNVREHEADVGALASFDDDDDGDGSNNGSENREDLDGEEAAPEEN
ncbi:uncharacterized protein [Nicotiana tomentosiformis]|uniref:uncharacterized protein n=1 Tax=Nicotiana tomentosiformis TaxID=4098 RepID=UPI00388CAB29